MVANTWPDDDPWLAVAPGSPAEARHTRSPTGTAFPANGKPLPDDLAHIAHLEALRYQGHHHLVVPEGSRPWFQQQAELRDHVVSSYLTVADQVGAGLAFDLESRADAGAETLRAAVARVTEAAPDPPAVLDWTDLGLAGELRGTAFFTPPSGLRLPYLDGTIDVVVIGANGDLAEARRVATQGVVTVEPGPAGPVVRAVEALGARHDAGPIDVVLWSAESGDPLWASALAQHAATVGAEVRVGSLDAGYLSALDTQGVLVAVDVGVLPLRGTLALAAARAAAAPDRAVAGKVLRADGRLESAGGTVFSDRSVGLIANGSAEVRAPWHEYVRPVCWGPGLVAAAGPLWRTVPAPAGATGRSFLREWCGSCWAHGAAVWYEPALEAVRVAGDGVEPSTPLASSVWQRVLDLRPARPPDLSDGAWRYLLAHDDVEACRG
jgi:hypothetical protein